MQFLQEFWPGEDARSLILKVTLAIVGVSSRSLSGPYTPALISNASQFSANSSEMDLCRPLLLGEALGLLFPPLPGTHCGKVTQNSMPWLHVASFESLRSRDTAIQDLAAQRWYAQSRDRHRLVASTLKVLVQSQSRLEGDIGIVRALFELESSCVRNREGQLEIESVAGKRGHSAAKRWLANNSEDPQVWSAFAALETRRGRHAQALNVRPGPCN